MGKSLAVQKGGGAEQGYFTRREGIRDWQEYNGDETVTDKPSLILVRPAVNVLGKSTIRLANPKGWYCFKSNVTVAGKIAIEAHCDARIASAREDGTSVMATDESKGGVAVMGALRVSRFGCK